MAPLLDRIEQLIPMASQPRCFERVRRHLLSDLVTLGRHTVTARILTGGGLQDWSADYRLYSRDRFCPDAVFDIVSQQLQQRTAPGDFLLVAIDDSILRKRWLLPWMRLQPIARAKNQSEATISWEPFRPICYP